MKVIPRLSNNLHQVPQSKVIPSFRITVDYEVPDEGYSRLSNLLTEVPDQKIGKPRITFYQVPDKRLEGFRIFSSGT